MPFARRRAETRPEAARHCAPSAISGSSTSTWRVPGDRFGDSLEVHFRLAGAGHAVQQRARQSRAPRPPAGVRRHRACAGDSTAPVRRQSVSCRRERSAPRVTSTPAATRPRTTASLQAASRASSADGPGRTVGQHRQHACARFRRLDVDGVIGSAQRQTGGFSGVSASGTLITIRSTAPAGKNGVARHPVDESPRHFRQWWRRQQPADRPQLGASISFEPAPQTTPANTRPPSGASTKSPVATAHPGPQPGNRKAPASGSGSSTATCSPSPKSPRVLQG